MAVAAQNRRLASPAVRSLIRRRLSELGAVALAVCGVALLVALGSYDSGDPSLNTAAVRGVYNLAGPPGAIVADLLLQGFGLAGVLPGLALLAWSWRIGSHRGLGAAAPRIAALLAALPVLSAVLAALPALPVPLAWPTAAGPGGAGGKLLAASALAAGRGIFGPPGVLVVWTLGATLGAVLTLLALGLSAGEWRAAARALRTTLYYARRVIGLLARIIGRIIGFGLMLLRRLNGTTAPEARDEFAPPRAEPRILTPGIADSPREPAPAKARVSASARRPAPARQESLPLDGTWQPPPLSLLASVPPRASLGAPSEEALQANARLLESVLAITACRGRSWKFAPAQSSPSMNWSPRPASAARA